MQNVNTIQLNTQLIMTVRKVFVFVIDLFCAYNHSFLVLYIICKCGHG